MNQTNTGPSQALRARHTPVPWTVHPQYTDRSVFPIGTTEPDGSSIILAEVNSRGGTEENQRANAEFIVRACNSHADLLAALEECVTEDGAHCLAYGTDTPKLRARLEAVNQIARAAIAQASPTI